MKVTGRRMSARNLRTKNQGLNLRKEQFCACTYYLGERAGSWQRNACKYYEGRGSHTYQQILRKCKR